MKYSPVRRHSFTFALFLPLVCLTAGAAERSSAATPLSGGEAALAAPASPAEETAPLPPLEAVEAAVRAAQQAGDAPREAEGLTQRSRSLERLGRFPEATASWAEAERAWAALGNRARQIEALIGGSLTSRDRPETQRLVGRAVELGTAIRHDLPPIAETLQQGGVAFDARGDSDPARRLFEAALALYRRIRPDGIEVAAQLDRIGNLLSRTGDLPGSEMRHHQALELWDRVAPEGPDRAQCLMFLCQIKRRLRKLPEAMDFGTRAVELYARADLGSPQHIAALRQLAHAMLDTGEVEGARRRLQRLLSMATGPDFEVERRQCLDLLGNIAERTGAPQEAAEYFAAALALMKGSATEAAQTANLLRAYARALGRLRREQEAQTAFTQALEIAERTMPGSMMTAHTLREMGELAHQSKDREGSRVFFGRALEIVRRHPQAVYDLVVLLTRLGSIAFEEGNFPRAEAYLAEGEEAAQLHRPGSAEHAQILIRQGWIAERKGELDRADDRYRRAKEMVLASGSDPTSVGQLEQAQGILASHRRDYQAAIRHFQAALKLRERFSPDPLGLGLDLANLGGVYLSQKQFADAEPWLARAWKLIREELDSVNDAQALSAVGADRQWIAGGLAYSYAKLRKPLAALRVVEQARARSLAALLNDERSVDATTSREVVSLLDRAQAERDRAQNELASRSQELLRAEARLAQDPENPRVRAEIEALHAAFERAREEFVAQRATVSRLRAGAGLKRPEFTGSAAAESDVAAAVRRLPPGTLYLAYQMTNGRVVLIAAEGGSPPPRGTGPESALKVSTHELTGTVPELAEQVDRYLGAMAAASGEAVARGKRLSDTLFPVTVREALQRAKRCVISPDGPLWSLPFAALPLPSTLVPAGQKEPGYLGLTRSLTLASSLSLYDGSGRGAPARVPGRSLEVLAVGDPVFDRSVPPQERLALASDHRAFLFADGRPPQPLPGTRADATAVARAYGASPLLGEAATEAAVRRRLPSADVVHLATHGYLNPRWALASGVLLTEPARPTTPRRNPPAGDPGPRSAVEPRSAGVEGRPGDSEDADPRDNGALLAWEILSQLRLRADLVVLAACETGRGEYLRGEGLQGLTRSLHVAGARSVVASFWKVRDDSTRVLMERLHQGVRAGLSKDEALRRAMLEVSQRKGWAHPFYWAGFALTGDRENRLFAAAAPATGARPSATRAVKPARPNGKILVPRPNGK